MGEENYSQQYVASDLRNKSKSVAYTVSVPVGFLGRTSTNIRVQEITVLCNPESLAVELCKCLYQTLFYTLLTLNYLLYDLLKFLKKTFELMKTVKEYF